jgi:hypothetical protein
MPMIRPVCITASSAFSRLQRDRRKPGTDDHRRSFGGRRLEASIQVLGALSR